MSANDRCQEALDVLRLGGAIPDVPEVREALMSWFQDGADGVHFPPRDMVLAIRDHPDNARMRERVLYGDPISDDEVQQLDGSDRAIQKLRDIFSNDHEPTEGATP